MPSPPPCIELTLGLVVAAQLIVAVVVTSGGRTGSATDVWAWLLTSLQIGGMALAGTGRRIGWILGAAVQPAWITYAFVTGQEGFIVGCAVSAAVQVANYIRANRAVRTTTAMCRPSPSPEL